MGDNERPDGTALRRAQQELLERISAMRTVMAGTPPAPDAQLSDRELARQLMYDTLATLTRSEIVLQHAAEIVEANTHELRRANDHKDREAHHSALVASRHRELETSSERALAFVGIILGDSKVRTAITSSIITVVTTGAAWFTASFFGVHP